MTLDLTCFVGSFPKRKRLSAVRRALSAAWRDHGGLELRFAGETASTSFLDGIRRSIDDAFVCLFDVTEVRRSDVLLEIGYAVGQGKDCLFVIKRGHEPPVSLAGIEVVEYGSLSDLGKRLARHPLLPSLLREVPGGREARAEVA